MEPGFANIQRIDAAAAPGARPARRDPRPGRGLRAHAALSGDGRRRVLPRARSGGRWPGSRGDEPGPFPVGLEGAGPAALRYIPPVIPAPAHPKDSPHDLRRVLGLWDATCVVIGAIIGVGIFFSPRDVARIAGSTPAALLAWTIGGVIALLGAFTFAELGRLRPFAGGQYHILRDTYGRMPAFLFVFCNLTAVQAGAVAIIAISAPRIWAWRFTARSPPGAWVLVVARCSPGSSPAPTSSACARAPGCRTPPWCQARGAGRARRRGGDRAVDRDRRRRRDCHGSDAHLLRALRRRHAHALRLRRRAAGAVDGGGGQGRRARRATRDRARRLRS